MYNFGGEIGSDETDKYLYSLDIGLLQLRLTCRVAEGTDNGLGDDGEENYNVEEPAAESHRITEDFDREP